MKKIIILQLARLGDIIQTLPTVQGLKAANPGCEITLVVRERFAAAALISPHVDKLVVLPTADLIGPALLSDAGRVISNDLLADWIVDNFAATRYDLLLNLTFSKAS